MSNSADAAIGMMDGAYFTSRSDILDFFNGVMDMNLTKIEQTATGAVACQLTDIIFPKSIPMSRVNWEAKTPYEYVNNYKLLQASFSKNRVARHVDVDKLIRAKYQDNLEFCQWLKAFYEQAAPAPPEGYDPLAVRMKGKGGKKLPPQFQGGGGGGGARAKPSRPAATTRQRPAPKSPARTKKPTGGVKTGPVRVATGGAQKENNSAASTNAGRGGGKSKDSSSADAAAIVADATLMKKNKDLTDRNAELELTLGEIENERDFYFEKLRGIEVMLQVYEEKGPAERDASGGSDDVMAKIFKVLYATADDKVLVGDDGELVVGEGDPEVEGEDFYPVEQFAEEADGLEESLLDD